MRMETTVSGMQHRAQRWKREGTKIGFVPTMGSLHAGHLGLVERARKAIGRNGRIVVSIYVNPAQFGPREDLARYPRNLARDRALCREADVDLLFVPDDAGMYPRPQGREFSTWITEERLSRGMEGCSRPGHFRGVATVVGKLFNIVQPDVAVFGAKDFQQARIIQRMARDLNFPVRVIVAPTAREEDGLAMSSRNEYLSPEERRQAAVLIQAIRHARRRVRAGRGWVTAGRLRQEVRELIGQRPAARVDYVEFFDADTLEPVTRVTPGTRMALGVFVGRTRLIDNGQL
jgi:pantoate--beta-alanine ligase